MAEMVLLEECSARRTRRVGDRAFEPLHKTDQVLAASQAVLPQLQQVQPSGAAFDGADIGLPSPQQRGEVGLVQLCLIPHLAQEPAQLFVFGFVDGFDGHCGTRKRKAARTVYPVSIYLKNGYSSERPARKAGLKREGFAC